MPSIDTVNDLPPRVQYVALAAQTAFDYPFPIFEDADLVVNVDGVDLSLSNDYTVTGEGDDTGGTVTLVDALSGGEIVTIYRDITIARDTDVDQNGPWRSAVYNDEQDKIFLLLQQLEARIARSLRLPIVSEVDDVDLELDPAAYANKYLAFDVDGRPTPAVLSDTTITRALLGQLLYPTDAAESTVTVVNYWYEVGVVDRYGNNSIPGTTDMSAAFQAAVDVALAATGTGRYGVPVRFLSSAYKIVTPPTMGPASTDMKSLDIGGVGTGTQIINAATSSKPTFAMTTGGGFYLHDMLLTGNSTHPNDAILVSASGAQPIRWRIERIVSMMPGRGIVLSNTNTGVIRDFRHWPDSGDDLLTVAQSVTTTDIDHGIYLTGSFVHDISIYDADCFPRDSFKANAAGIRCDSAGPNHGIRIFGGMVQGNAGNGRSGVYLQNCTSGLIHGTYHESSRIRLSNCSSVSVIATNNGGVEGVVSIDTNTVGCLFQGNSAASFTVDDISCTNNTISGSAFAAITDAAKPNNVYINTRGVTGFSGGTRGGTPWTTVAYSASMTPNCDSGKLFNIVPSNGTAFTVNEPSNPMDGDRVLIKIRNATGGALGTLTWGAQIRAVSTTQPANGFSIIREFTHDKSYGSGVLWIQTGADVTVAN